MAEQRRRNSYRTYRTSGNVAYDPNYEGNAVRLPKRQEVQLPKPKDRPSRRKIVRPQVEVRQAGHVSPFAVVGFLAVGVFAALLLFSYVQLMVSSNAVVSLRSQLSQLDQENAELVAQYEQVFDMEHLQQAVGGTMTRPTGDQIRYIDLSEPDSVILHSPQDGAGAGGLWGEVSAFFSGLLEYFR